MIDTIKNYKALRHKWAKLMLCLLLCCLLVLTGCGGNAPGLEEGNESWQENQEGIQDTPSELDDDYEMQSEVQFEEGQPYSSKDEVAAYLHLFKSLPPNFITKKEAGEAGWDNSKGNLWEVTDKKSIGGDYFGNREGLLPNGEGRRYFECDIDYQGGYRGPERIVYSNDGLIFYTADHYESFEQLY